MSEPIISIENLSCKSGNRYILHNINWRVNAGEHWIIFGKNGCGKTTLLSCIAGFKSASSGTVKVLGEEYTTENIFSLRKRVGWVSSSFFDNYFKNESAMQIVLSGLFGTFGIDYNVRDQDVRTAKALLRELHMEDKIKQPFHTMSKGERQNILIARALISKPEILLLDEPGTGLDIDAREHMMAFVADLAKQRKVTVIYVTHYPEEVQSFMNKTMLLQNGQVYAKGNTEDVMIEEKLSTFFDKPVQIRKQEDGRLRLMIKNDSNISHFYGADSLL